MARRFARQLGAYDGESEEEKYWVDAMCDLAADCKTMSIFDVWRLFADVSLLD